MVQQLLTIASLHTRESEAGAALGGAQNCLGQLVRWLRQKHNSEVMGYRRKQTVYCTRSA
jgi:hypothetical protein